jgi:hypothetical protein
MLAAPPGSPLAVLYRGFSFHAMAGARASPIQALSPGPRGPYVSDRMILPMFSFLSIRAVASWSLAKGNTESTTGLTFP